MKLASKDERWNEIMFVHLKDFKRLLKQAYTGVGLCVARRGDDVLFGGSDWVIVTEKESMDKKQLELAAGLSGFEIAGLRDRRTGKEYYRNDDGVHERKQ